MSLRTHLDERLQCPQRYRLISAEGSPQVEELTTDDGLQLSGTRLLEARSNWVIAARCGRSQNVRKQEGSSGYASCCKVGTVLLLN